MSACTTKPVENPWQQAIQQQAGQLGYRNWIVIAEASFPAFSGEGVRQVSAEQSIPIVLDEVLSSLERTEHVRPEIYMPRELRAVENDYAPGMDQFREQLNLALRGFEPTQVDQSSLMVLLEDARHSFDVLVIRTTTALPYTSVFLELQPGYWDGESESRLREHLRDQENQRQIEQNRQQMEQRQPQEQPTSPDPLDPPAAPASPPSEPLEDESAPEAQAIPAPPI